jgi:hypothetical protein
LSSFFPLFISFYFLSFIKFSFLPSCSFYVFLLPSFPSFLHYFLFIRLSSISFFLLPY